MLVTHGAIGANALVHQALVEPGDRVVALVAHLSAALLDPRLDRRRCPLAAFALRRTTSPDLDELRALVGTHAKLIAFSNPEQSDGFVDG